MLKEYHVVNQVFPYYAASLQVYHNYYAASLQVYHNYYAASLQVHHKERLLTKHNYLKFF